MVRILRFIFL